MKVERKDLDKSQVELTVELSLEEFKPYIEEGARQISKEVKIDGFRSGKIPFEVLKAKVGEMSILEEAAKIAINKTFDKAIKEGLKEEQPVGQPRVDITKLAPENPVEYKALLALLPKVTIGQYKELNVKREPVKVEEKEVEKTIEAIRESRAKEVLVTRGAKNGDKILLDLEMFLDNVPLEGGQMKGMAVILGKEYFVPGFDKEVDGMKKDETREFKLPYPKDFHQASLAGKMVEFKVKFVDVFERQIPEADDKLAESFGAKTIEELKKNIRTGIESEKKQEAERKTEARVIEEVLKHTKFSDIPDVLIDNESETIMKELEHSVTSQGGRMEDYMANLKKTRDELKLDMSVSAVKRIKSALLIREIAIAEKIEVSEEEIEKKKEELLDQYKGYEKVAERINGPEYRSVLHNILSNQKVVDKLKTWNLAK